ncbi:MAG TPA: SpoIIE family protein phosphatase [Acidimicrobiales bacterium]|nr:SpoIIE family protein phosphatase [Acidimicrobiales bacterium]
MLERLQRDAVDVPRAARALVVERAAEIGREDLADDAALVVSELVTNAMLHGGGCRSVDVTACDGGLRIQVRDHSAVPPVFGHASEESLTGRGVRVVNRLATRWGGDAEPDGKVVWAEVTGDHGPSHAASSGDILADWADDWSDAAERQLFHIELGDVPTDLLLAAKSHVDNVVREFALAAAGAEAGITAALPPDLASLVAVVDRFADARLSIKHQALEATRRGKPTARLALDLPAEAADAAVEYLAALDEVDAYCRAMRLLTLETPPQHKVFRHWYIGELVTQLRAAASGSAAPPVQAFERRLLVELDRVAAAQRASMRAARLYSVASALASAGTPEAVTSAVLNEGVAALGASGGGVLLSGPGGGLSVSSAVGYDEAIVERLGQETPDDQLPAAMALRTGEPVWLESRAERDRRFPDLATFEATTVALCAVPLEVEGRRLGSLRFSFTEPRLFDEDERRFVLALAAQTAQALDRSQLQRARVEVSNRLQRSLLPPRLPVIPGLEVAAMYHPFGDGVEIGGDFYDVWPIDTGRWAIAIGDAAGTGPEAAALTALVRHTLRALTMSSADPEWVVRALNTALWNSASEDDDDDRFCTALFGVVSIGECTEVKVAGGGHPPVFVRRGDGQLETKIVGGSLLGVFPDIEVGLVEVGMEAGDAVLLLTDGVLEARCRGAQFEIDGVLEVLGRAGGTARAMTDDLQAAVLAHTDGVLTDDMAAVVLRAGGR